jgi:hypothetical protein
MKWTIVVEKNEREKIEVVYHPLKDSLVFTGKYRTKSHGWIDFSTEEISVTTSDIDLNVIRTTISTIHDKLKIRREVYDNLSEGFNYIQKVELEE